MRRVVRDTTAPFLRFDPRIGWPLTDAPQSLGITQTQSGLQLGVPGAKPIADAEPLGSLGGRRSPKGFAISTEGRIFLADPAGRVVLSGTAFAAPDKLPDPRLTPLWPARDLPKDGGVPADPYALARPVDVALAPNGDLAIVDEAARRVLVLAFPTAFIRQVISFPDHAPTAIVFDRNGCAHLLLIPEAPGAVARIVAYDHAWREIAGFPHAGVTLNSPRFLAAVPDADCTCSPATGCGCGKTCGCGGCGADTPPPPLIVVLDNAGLRAIGVNGREIAPLPELPLRLSPPPLRLSADRTPLYDDPAMPNHDPIRLEGVALSPEGTLSGTTLGLIALPRRIELPRYGILILDALDGGRNRFHWDRIALDLTLPLRTRLLVSTLTSDSALEPDRVKDTPADRWSRPLDILPEQTPEVLVQSPPGRYLWLRLEFFGDGSVTPTIAAADVFAPRRSSLHDLPALFQQDAESAHFLDRFLSYFDTGLNEISAISRRIPELLDPYATDPAFLPWLGSWFDLSFLADWSEATRREMIAEAIVYFRMRGTIAGLRKILQWHTGLTGDMPQIIEHFRLAAFAEPPQIAGQPIGGGSPAHRFTIVIPESAAGSEEVRARLERLIAASIPAHTGYDLIVMQPGIAIGRQSTVAVDTLLGHSFGAPLGAARLGDQFSTQGPVISGPLPFHANPIRGQNPC